jgi:hypothetical protein
LRSSRRTSRHCSTSARSSFRFVALHSTLSLCRHPPPHLPLSRPQLAKQNRSFTFACVLPAPPFALDLDVRSTMARAPGSPPLRPPTPLTCISLLLGVVADHSRTWLDSHPCLCRCSTERARPIRRRSRSGWLPTACHPSQRKCRSSRWSSASTSPPTSDVRCVPRLALTLALLTKHTCSTRLHNRSF